MKTLITLDQYNPNDETSKIISLKFENEEYVKKDDVIIEAETSKATIEIPVEKNGYILYNCEEGNEIKVNSVLAFIFENEDELKNYKKEIILKNEKLQNERETNTDNKPISAKVLKKAQELNISLNILKDNKITTIDELNKYQSETKIYNEKNLLLNLADHKQQTNSKIKLNEIKNLRQSLNNTIPCFCSLKISKFDIKKLNSKYKLFFNNLCPYFIYISSAIINNYKNLNGFYYKDSKYFYDKINIGFTIETDKEMSVPVIRDCYEKKYEEIQSEYISKFKSYENETLSIDDISKCTFVVSDLSSIGDVFMHAPIMYNFTSSILGVALDKETQEMILTLTYDHQMSTGKEALEFLKDLKSKVEEDLK